LKTLIHTPEFGGVALEDAGWDDFLPVQPEDVSYSSLVHKMFNPEVKIDVWKPKVTTTTTTTPAPLSKYPVGKIAEKQSEGVRFC